MPTTSRLVETTYESMMRGIAVVKPGAHIGDIGHAIQSFVEPLGYSVVRDFVGHGVGKIFHTEPTVFHFGHPGEGPEMVPGILDDLEAACGVRDGDDGPLHHPGS